MRNNCWYFHELLDDRLVARCSLIAHPRVDPLPEGADLLGGFAAWRVFADRKARAQRVLVIVAHHDGGSGKDIVDVERGLVAQRVLRAGEPRRSPDRGLVQDIGERLAPGPDDAERRGGRLDIGDARARRDQAEVGITNRRNGRGADRRRRYRRSSPSRPRGRAIAGAVRPPWRRRSARRSARHRDGDACQFETVPCESVSIRRTLCPARMAASARLMASVLLPEPPFWVANTIVCISDPLDGFQAYGLRHTSRAAFCDAELRARSDVPSPIQKVRGSRLSESVSLQ